MGEENKLCVFIKRNIYKELYIYISMDGRTRYNKMSKLLEPIVGQTIHMDKIRFKIMINIGTSEKLIHDTLRFMIDTGLIKETKHLIFKIQKAELDG